MVNCTGNDDVQVRPGSSVSLLDRADRSDGANRVRVYVPLLEFNLHWSLNGWTDARDDCLVDGGLRVYFLDLATEKSPVATDIDFTFFWLEPSTWEGANFRVIVC
ncbi:MAG: hypothetical protein ACREU6_01105 [Steroidobacteraceae bacterium]